MRSLTPVETTAMQATRAMQGTRVAGLALILAICGSGDTAAQAKIKDSIISNNEDPLCLCSALDPQHGRFIGLS